MLNLTPIFLMRQNFPINDEIFLVIVQFSAPFGNANPYANTNYPLHRPQRPSSAILPTR